MPMNHSPAAERNQQPIFEYLSPCFKRMRDGRASLHCLEIASGTGQHSAYFASRDSHLIMHPSDQNLGQQESVALWARHRNVTERVNSLIQLDVTDSLDHWPKFNISMIYCANMVHISPWEATVGLFRGAGGYLDQNGILVLYGPYRFNSVPLVVSNQAFDDSLKMRNPLWGIRAIAELDHLGQEFNLRRIETYTCPANNHVLIYQKQE